MTPLRISRALMKAVRRHAEEAYPFECCGALLYIDGKMEARQFKNAQNENPMDDHEGAVRSAETAYRVSPEDEKRLHQELAGRAELAAIYHSHPNAAAYFSEMDKHAAMAGGAWDFPAYPDHLVVSVMEGEAREARAFSWDEETAEFVERAVEIMENAS